MSSISAIIQEPKHIVNVHTRIQSSKVLAGGAAKEAPIEDPTKDPNRSYIDVISMCQMHVIYIS